MEDAIRPTESAFRRVYERGFRTWAALWQTTLDDSRELPPQPLFRTSLYSAFPSHAYIPERLLLDKSYSNVATVSGKTTWTTTRTQEPCGLPPFQEEAVLQVAWNRSTDVLLRRDPHLEERLQSCFRRGYSHHIPILFFAWAYILSARWAELIPGARGPTYPKDEGDDTGSSEHVAVDIGNADEDAVRWWTAVLSAGSCLEGSIRNDKGAVLVSPWSIRTPSEKHFVVSSNLQTRSSTQLRPASSQDAILYLSEYCRLHGISEQSDAALAFALLIPVAKLDGQSIELPWPQPRQDGPGPAFLSRVPLAWAENPQQLDRLLTLSCNPRGVKALLSSIFFQPDIECNICGAWLQGSFAFLDSAEAREPGLRLHTFMRRDPGLEFLWFGAFVTGAEARCIQDARAGWWKADLSSAAWTGTHVSFIQEAVSEPSPSVTDISRADECRLLYLTHGPNYATPPIFPFAPFGSTALADTDLDVRQHTQCAIRHRLGYSSFVWNCQEGRKVEQRGNDEDLEGILRFKTLQKFAPSGMDNITVDYGDLYLEDDNEEEEEEEDDDDEVSEMVTRNIFTWLRGEDGFPVAERAIRQHEWIDNLDSDDDSPIQGDVRSTAGDNLGRWLLGQATRRCNSL